MQNLESHRRFGKVCLLLGKWFRVYFGRLLPWRLSYSQSHYVLMEATPFSLLQGFLSDMRTALYRMGQRVDKLPFLWSRPVGPCFEQAPNGSWIPNKRTHGCMTDMQRFERDNPQATPFDWETYRTGWEAGARWADGSAYIQEQEESTCNSPIAL